MDVTKRQMTKIAREVGKLVGCDYVYSRTLPPAEEDT